jgi:hypothetical protein
MRRTLLTLLSFLIFTACTKKIIDESPKEILSFELQGFNSTKASIDLIKKTISIEVPYNTSLKELTPILKVNAGVNIVPASGTKQDFSKAIYYTLIGADGSKAIYTVLIKSAEQPSPILASIKSDTVEAGFDFDITGQYFGRFQLDVNAYLIDAQKKEIKVESQLMDSARIKINVPIDFVPNSYQVKLVVKQKEVLSTQKIVVQYPKPQLLSALRKNLLQGDSLYIKGKYIDALQYKIALTLSGKTGIVKLLNPQLNNQGLGFVLPKNISVGQYTIGILNESINKKSLETGFLVMVYDSEKPTVTGFVNKKSVVKQTEQVQLTTKNFEKVNARFYQVGIRSGANTYFVNGVYDGAKKQLNIDLPANIQKGQYYISVSFINTDGKENYAFEIDDVLGIQ